MFAESDKGADAGRNGADLFLQELWHCRLCVAARRVHRKQPAGVVARREPIDRAGLRGGELEFCPLCINERSLHPERLSHRRLACSSCWSAFAISTVFWYYEMPLLTYLVLIISIALDFLLYYQVPDVTICYRCLSQFRGKGQTRPGRFKPFDLGIGERYRQERMRAEQIRESES